MNSVERYEVVKLQMGQYTETIFGTLSRTQADEKAAECNARLTDKQKSQKIAFEVRAETTYHVRFD
jgi:hypothetical protein